MTYRRYFLLLARLLAGAGRNPVVVASAPLKPRTPGFVWTLLTVGASGLILLIGLASLLDGARGSHSMLDQLLASLGWSAWLFATPVVMPISILVLGARWRQPDRVHDLYLTTVNPREAALGGVFWGAVVGLMLPWASAVAIAVGMLPNWWREADEPWPYIVGVILVLWPLGVLGITIRMFLAWKGSFWRLALLVPLRAAATVFAVVSLLLMLISSMRFTYTNDEVATILFIAMLGLLTLHALRGAGVMAATRWMAPVRPDLVEERCLFDRFTAIRRDPEARRAAAAALKSNVPVARKTSVWLFGGLGLALAAVGALAQRVVGKPDASLYDRAVGEVPLLAAGFAAFAVWTAVVVARRRWPLVAGAPLRSLLKPWAPAGAVMTVLTLLLWAGRMPSPTDRLDEFIGTILTHLAWGAGFQGLVWAAVIQSATVRHRRLALAAHALGLLLFVLLAALAPPDEWGRTWAQPGVNAPEWLTPLLGLLLVVQAYRLPEMLQALHTRLGLGEREPGEVVELLEG
jgi:hypothetical protein